MIEIARFMVVPLLVLVATSTVLYLTFSQKKSPVTRRGTAMGESIHVEDKEQAHQKPPLSVARIVGEIFAGTVVGYAVAELAKYVLLVAGSGGDCMGFGALAVAAIPGFLIIPPAYGLASAIGVYLVGNRGKQTGSFLWILGCGFAGGLVIMGMRGVIHSFYWSYWLPSVPAWASVPLALLIPPLMATCVFNLTRRYKEPPSS